MSPVLNYYYLKFIRRFPEIKLLAEANEEEILKLNENYLVSNAKLKKALGIDKMPVSSEEGFVKTIKSFNN